MTEIKAIKASNIGDEKSEAYRLLNIIHVMAGRCAIAYIDGWELGETCTTDEYVRTTWTNGIVDVIAETWPDFGEHTYTLRKCREATNDHANDN